METQVYQLFLEIQTTHWWFVARRIILQDVLKRYLGSVTAPQGPFTGLRVADIGCGTGAMLPMLAQFGDAWGVDSSATAVELCHQKNLVNVYVDDDPAGVPPQEFTAAGQFDLLTFLDVIEHVDDDVAFLKKYLRQLKPDGLVMITVPALMFLWSDHDRLNHHRRRYTARQLRKVVEHAGLVPRKISYFNTWLFPVIAFVRLTMRVKNSLTRRAGLKRDKNAPLRYLEKFWKRGGARTDFERNISFMNGILRVIFSSERFVLRYGSFPLGTSLLCIAHKRAHLARLKAAS